MDSNEEDKQPVFIPQPPKIVSASVRYKRYKQLANRRNIATSPISTLNLEENESSFDLSREPTSPTNPVEPQKPNKSRRKKQKQKTFNNLNIKNDKQQKEPAPTPPKSSPKTRILKSSQAQKRHHSPNLSNKNDTNKSYDIPSPQVVLDVEAVKNQIDHGNIELLPLIQRIEYDQISSQNSKGSLKFNDTKSDQNNINTSPQCSSVRPLIEQNRKQIFFPNYSSCFDDNQRSQKVRNQQSARISKKSIVKIKKL